MKGKLWCLLLCLSLCHSSGHAQGADSLTADLSFYADVMANAIIADHRIRAQGEFAALFRKWLEKEERSELHFDSLPWTQKVISDDSTVAVYTWQLELSADEYKYFGFVEWLADDGKRQIYKLTDNRSLRSESAFYDNETWYGALYYGILDFAGPDDQKAYMLVGLNANNSLTNLKVADILLPGDETIRFGADLFDHPDGVKARIIIEYSDAASGRMQFDREKGLLVLDNIIVIEGGPDGPIPVPDGSFKAYQYGEGRWEYIDKLFLQTVDTPPGEGLPKDDIERDILGRKKD